MLAIERRNRILARLRAEKHVVVSELAKQFEVSEETIRRDLDKMEKEGQVVKSYGGAVLSENGAAELPFVVRKRSNVAEKQKIAELAASLVSDGDAIILDASSTAVFIARKLKTKKNITIITNSVEVLMELSDVTGWRILSTGGTLKENSCALIGPQAEEMLASYHVGKVILSCKGVDEDGGFSDSNDSHASLKRKMLACGAQKIFAVDSSKFGKRSFIEISGFEGIDAVLTDKRPPEHWVKLLASHGVELLCPEESQEEETA